MRGLATAVKGIITALTAMDVPPWALAILVGVGLWFMFPKFVAALESDKPRRMVKRAMMADAQEQQKVGEQALALSAQDPTALVVLADEAIRMGRDALAEQCLERLRASGQRPKDVARLELTLLGPLPGTEMEAAIIVERMLDSGMTSAAAEKLERFRRRWPDDADLAGLASRLHEAEGLPTPPEGDATA